MTGSMNVSADDGSPRRPRVVDELFRTVLGGTLRELRLGRGERLDDTAGRAGISPQYLSEVERGRKDASSEMIAAIVGALDTSLSDVLVRVASELAFAGSVDVIDIRSSARSIRSTGNRPPMANNEPTQATLSIAA